MFTNPEALGSAPWAPNQSVDDNATTAPDGTVTADRIIDSSGGGTGQVRTSQNIVLTPFSTYYLPIWAKRDGLDWLRIYGEGFSANPSYYFNLNDGSFSGSPANQNTIEYPDDWWRCWIKVDTTADATGVFRFGVAEADGDDVVDRDGTSSIFLWGADLTLDALEDYTSEDGQTSPFNTQAPPYLAVTRRTAQQMRPKQRMAKPTRGLFK